MTMVMTLIWLSVDTLRGKILNEWQWKIDNDERMAAHIYLYNNVYHNIVHEIVGRCYVNIVDDTIYDVL